MMRPPWQLVTLVPYTLMGLLAAYLLITEGLSIDLGLLAVAAAWMLGTFTLRPRAWDRLGPMALCSAGLIVLTIVLVLRNPVFGLLTPVAYIHAFAILPWPWRLPAVALVAVAAGLAQASGVPKDDAAGRGITVGIIAFNIAVMCGTGWALRNDERRQLELEQALADLSRANHLLEATAAENADLHSRLLAQARETGVHEERRRMAREIHDTVAQGLTGIIAQLHAAEQAREIPDPWHRHVEAAKGLARESLAEARRSVDALRPSPLATGRLGDALAEVAAKWSAVQGVPVRVTSTGTPRPIAPEHEFALLRTAQEALANVGRHAGATTAGLTLSYLEEEVALDVVDDGGGFDPSARPEGFGLGIMRERMESIGGTLRIESSPGAGTGISARVPR